MPLKIERNNPVPGGLFAAWQVNRLTVGVLPRKKDFAVICPEIGVIWGAGNDAGTINMALKILISAIAQGKSDIPTGLTYSPVFWDSGFIDWMGTVDQIETEAKIQNNLELQLARKWQEQQLSLL